MPPPLDGVAPVRRRRPTHPPAGGRADDQSGRGAATLIFPAGVGRRRAGTARARGGGPPGRRCSDGGGGLYSARRARSSADRALASGARGRRFESCRAYPLPSPDEPNPTPVRRRVTARAISAFRHGCAALGGDHRRRHPRRGAAADAAGFTARTARGMVYVHTQRVHGRRRETGRTATLGERHGRTVAPTACRADNRWVGGGFTRGTMSRSGGAGWRLPRPGGRDVPQG